MANAVLWTQAPENFKVIVAALFMAFAALAMIAAFWWKERSPARMVASLLGLAGASLVIWLAWNERPQLTVARDVSPAILSIAIDLSPSMLAQPSPTVSISTPPRVERALGVIAEVIDGLEASQDPYLVSVIGFAGDAGVLIGWNDNLAEVREILDYTVTPDLFSDNGTSIEAAARLIGEMFDLLPSRFKDARRVVIFVSDGEDTGRSGDLRYAAERLKRSNASLIALQAGLFEQNEGILVYDDMGNFQGFRLLGGRRYTKPKPETMQAIGEIGGGLYVRAEDASTPADILRELRSGVTTESFDTRLMPALGLFVLTVFSLVLVLR